MTKNTPISTSRSASIPPGITLENLLNQLVLQYGWNMLGKKINISCFNENPSIKSSLKFLRKNQWARDKVEALFMEMLSANKNL